MACNKKEEDDDIFSQVFEDHIYFKSFDEGTGSKYSSSNNNHNNSSKYNSNSKNDGTSKLQRLVGDGNRQDRQGLPDHLLTPSLSGSPTLPSPTFTDPTFSTTGNCQVSLPPLSTASDVCIDFPSELERTLEDHWMRSGLSSTTSSPTSSPSSSIDDEEEDEDEFGYNNKERSQQDWMI